MVLRHTMQMEILLVHNLMLEQIIVFELEGMIFPAPRFNSTLEISAPVSAYINEELREISPI